MEESTVCVIIDGEREPRIEMRLSQLLKLYQEEREQNPMNPMKSWERKNAEENLLWELESVAKSQIS